MLSELTAYLLLGIVVVLTIYDICAIATMPTGCSVSEVIARAGRVQPILPLTLGVLLGHVFCVPCAWTDEVLRLAQKYPLAVLLVGIGLGCILWPVAR